MKKEPTRSSEEENFKLKPISMFRENFSIHPSCYSTELSILSTQAEKLGRFIDPYLQRKETSAKASRAKEILSGLMSDLTQHSATDINRHIKQLDKAVKLVVPESPLQKEFKVFTNSLSGYLTKTIAPQDALDPQKQKSEKYHELLDYNRLGKPDSDIEWSLIKRFTPEAFNQRVLDRIRCIIKEETAGSKVYFYSLLKSLNALRCRESFLESNVESLNQMLMDKTQSILNKPTATAWELRKWLDNVNTLVDREAFSLILFQLLSADDFARMQQLLAAEFVENFREYPDLEPYLRGLFPDYKRDVIQWIERQIHDMRTELLHSKNEGESDCSDEESIFDAHLWKEEIFVWLELKTAIMKTEEAPDASIYRLLLDVIRILNFPDDTKPHLILLRFCGIGYADEGIRIELKGVLEAFDNKLG